MLFKLSNLNSNLALTLGYLNPALNNSALELADFGEKKNLARCSAVVPQNIKCAANTKNIQ